MRTKARKILCVRPIFKEASTARGVLQSPARDSVVRSLPATSFQAFSLARWSL